VFLKKICFFLVRGSWANLAGQVLLVLVPVFAGLFLMGSPVTEPGHEREETACRVTFTQGFHIGRTPVTRRQWAVFMGGDKPG